MVVTILPPLSYSGFEVYETEKDKKDDKDKDKKDKDSKESDKNKKTAATSSSNLSDAEKELQRFIAMNGEIKEIAYYDEMYDNGFDEDYEGISNNGSVSFQEVDTSRFIKGKKICLKKANETGKPLKWKDLESCLLGFIAEQTYTPKGVDIKLVGMSKLLDQEKQFTFKKTKRSKILKEMIESAGLKAKIDTTGLKDDEIDFTNVSSSNSGSSSGLAGGEGKTIDELVAQIVGSETDDLAKAKLVHGWLQQNVQYPPGGYECSRYHSAEECLNHKGALNCADTARLTRAMMASAGLTCYVVHRSSHDGHFWTVIEIGGKIYVSDQTGSGSPWNTWWYAEGDRRECDSRGGDWDIKNGKNPDC